MWNVRKVFLIIWVFSMQDLAFSLKQPQVTLLYVIIAYL